MMKRTGFVMLLLLLLAVGAEAQINITLSTAAKMKVYLPDADKANGRAILICPGGGYSYLAESSEGYDWAPYFNEMGYVAAVLYYRMPNGSAGKPLEDAQKAVKYLRARGEKWNIRNGCVGVMGFSAGGHLASTLATHATAESGSRPDFQVLFYPVITMDPSYTHLDSHDHLLGANATEELEISYSSEKQVTEETPPAFITYAANDGTVSTDNSKNYYEALVQHGVSAYIKEYPTGGHGFGFKTTFAYHDDVLAELSAWLGTLDDLLPDAMNYPQVSASPSSAAIYTLSGIPVATSLQALPKGIYIREGKKWVK